VDGLPSLDLAGIAEYIKSGRARHIVFATGAGISTGAGIPDFRTPGTGLYDNLQKFNLPDPTAIFDLDYFPRHPEAFFEIAAAILPGTFDPTAVHFFISLLAKKNLVQRVMTQNIDGLERQAGLPEALLTECHGQFYTAHCLNCRREFKFDEYRDDVKAGKVLRCPCGGLIKPDIVFFKEDLPQCFVDAVERDLPACDLLIVMGTSMLVQPFASVPRLVPETTPRLLLNFTAPPASEEMLAFSDGVFADANPRAVFGFGSKSNTRDVFVGGDVEVSVLALARLLGWDGELLAALPPAVRERVLKASNEAAP
jgi:NAD-dependent deacetylase sirtuin 2